MERNAYQDQPLSEERLCAQCRQLDLSSAGRDLSVERRVLAERAGSMGRYTPMTDVGVRVACLGRRQYADGSTECPVCCLLYREYQNRDFIHPNKSLQEDRDQFFYAFSAQYCFQETGMGLEHNFLVVYPDLDDDEEFGIEPVIVRGRQVHGINHKLHPDFTRGNNPYLVCRTAPVHFPSGLQPRPISAFLDISILKHWLGHCQASHDQCQDHQTRGDYPPGMRLIDCQKRIVIEAGQIDRAVSPSYVALSYVWGGAHHPPIQQDAHLPAALPQVIEDAIAITLATGYRYLWVDQYCIDQDDSPHKIHQIKIMDRIYSDAAWTIVDGAGEDANHGLVGVSRPRAEDLGAVGMRNGIEVFPWPSYSAEILKGSKWAARAWTYQEAFFSRRIAMFTATGLYFECQKAYENEGLVRQENIALPERYSIASVNDHRPNFRPVSPKYDYGPLARSSRLWESIHRSPGGENATVLHDFWPRVEEYTCRQMTFQKDSLAAFRGIMQFYTRRATRADESLVLAIVRGIPFSIPSPASQLPVSSDLSLGLCWSHAHGSKSRRNHTFPSWSWAGWVGQAHGESNERVESFLWGISFESIDSAGTPICKAWYDMERHESDILLLEANVLPTDALSLTESGQWDAFGLGTHSRFDMDEDIQPEVILKGLRERTYVLVPIVRLYTGMGGNHSNSSAKMLLLRRTLDSFERVGLFIFGSSSVSFKMINLLNEGRTSWDKAIFRIT
ncbi:hypothetical protein J7T55_015242 [Diaporthe amygdali]|uniref:uncharacterized protein n=1 Tax=Phomopsis amygdali TaxID=1214568 RepID=UPI0022FE8810|nr:uncharacterized protein J7T55_015242 [Diaporthe amygdali]KAJ0120513.1 hypothetical protein J7T55_015242 [Diaporthe amygdali]